MLCYGIRESARANTVMVVIKLAVLALFLVLGVTAFTSDNLTPFTPNGADGVVTAAAVIFFAYIGFDAVSTSGEETRNPSRDLPIAIVGSLAIATVLYILVAVVAVGALPADQLAGAEAPLATAIDEGAGFSWASSIISFGALVAITSVVLTILYGQTRIMFAMCARRAHAAPDGVRAPEDPHARLHHGDVRGPDRDHRRVRAAVGDREAGQHRHAVRVRPREHRRDHPAPHAARTSSAASASRSCRSSRSSARCCAST